MEILKTLSFNDLSKKHQILLICSAIIVFILINIIDFKDFKAQVATDTGASLISDNAQELIIEDDTIDLGTSEQNLENTDLQVLKDLPKEKVENEFSQDLFQEKESENTVVVPEQIDITKTGSEIVELQEPLEPVLVENPVLHENIENNTGESESGSIVEKLSDNQVQDESEPSEILEEAYQSEQEIEVISNTQVDQDKKQEYLLNQNSQTTTEENSLFHYEDDLDVKIEEVVEKIILQNTNSNDDLPEDDFSVSGDEIMNFNNQVREDKYQKELGLQNQKIIALEEDRLALEEKLESLEEILNEKKYLSNQLMSNQVQGERSYRIINDEIEDSNLEKTLEENRIKKEAQMIARQKLSIALNRFKHDTDGDGLSDHIENQIGTNYRLIDSDFDGYSDLKEIEKGLNPIGENALFIDFEGTKSRTQSVIVAIKRSLVFLRVGDLFAFDEEIFRDEALKIVITALYPNEIYLDQESFSGVYIFDDIDSDDFMSMRTIEIAQKYKLLDGIIADKFKPYSTFSKADFVKILIQATGKPLTKEKRKWRDTNYDNWFTPYFSTAAEMGIISGSSSKRIQPLKAVTRIEALRMVVEAMKKK